MIRPTDTTTVFGPYREAIVALGESDPRVVVLGADLGNSNEIDLFRERFPERFFNLGAAEQNEVNVAAGLALEGFVPFVHSFGVFLTRRAYEQVCVQIAMQRANVKLLGFLPGLVSRLGPTHQATDDLALMSALPGTTVIAPADATEIAQVVRAIAEHDGPVYSRMLRREVPVLLDPETHRFEIGKAYPLSKGADVTLLTTGMMLSNVLEAARLLRETGVDAGVLHVPTVKPLDRDAILAAAARGPLVVVENHTVVGGLGAAVASLVSEHHPTRVKRLGLPDVFAVPGTPDYLFERYGLDAAGIARATAHFLGATGADGQ